MFIVYTLWLFFLLYHLMMNKVVYIYIKSTLSLYCDINRHSKLYIYTTMRELSILAYHSEFFSKFSVLLYIKSRSQVNKLVGCLDSRAALYPFTASDLNRHWTVLYLGLFCMSVNSHGIRLQIRRRRKAHPRAAMLQLQLPCPGHGQ